MDDFGEREFEIHFYECWDESIFLTEYELIEWFNDIKTLVNDDNRSIYYRMQKLVESITNG